MIDLTQAMRGCPVVVFDLETTGSKDDDRICELGVVLVDRLYETPPRRVEALCTLVNPEKPGPWQGSFVHGIREGHVRRAPTWETLWPLLSALFSTHLPCAYNASFDLRYLRIEADNVCSSSAPPTTEQTLDALPLVKRVDAPEGGKKAPKGHMTLSAACARRNIAQGGHRAPGDALATALLLPRLLGELYRRPELAAPPRPSVGEFLTWHRTPVSARGAQAQALPMAVTEKAQPVAEAGPKEHRSQAARLVWAVRGPAGSHTVGMLLAWHRGVDGSWRWVSRPNQGARIYETEEEAWAMARQCGGQPLFLESRARAS